ALFRAARRSVFQPQLSCITTDSYPGREKLRLALEKENIESRPLWKPMHLQPIFKDMPYYGGKIAEKLSLTGLCLPSGSNLTDSDRHRIRETLMNWLMSCHFLPW